MVAKIKSSKRFAMIDMTSSRKYLGFVALLAIFSLAFAPASTAQGAADVFEVRNVIVDVTD